jgi:Domain of unknown function (DUF4126)
MDVLPAVFAAVGLAACAGLRAFLPIFGIGLAARLFDWPLAPAVSWLQSDAALIIFGLASVLEIGADKIPVVDNALDTVHTFAGPAAGALVSFSPFVEISPPFALALAIMTGATIAGGVHALAATSRVKSTFMTAGIFNPLLSFLEDAVAFASLVMSLLAPLLILLFIIAIVLFFRSLRRRRQPPGLIHP